MPEAILSFGLLFVVVLSGFWVGGILLTRRVPALRPEGLAYVVITTALGLGLLGYGIGLMGWAYRFSPGKDLLWVLILGLLASPIRQLPHPLLERLPRLLASSKAWRPDALTGALTFVTALFALLTLTGALAPPTSNEWDTLAYHFAVPKVWLHDGRIHMLPYDNHAGFPMLTEMLYSVGLSVGNLGAAKLVHWFYGMLCALTCYWAARRWVSRKAGLLAAALFLAVPAVGWEATTAYIDLAAALYVSLGVFAFARWIESQGAGDGGRERGGESASPSPPHPLTPSSGWLVLAGICGGLACGVKMTMIATSGLLVLWAAGLALKRRAAWKQVGLLTGLMLAIGAPWYIKTWIWTGNPFYPFAYSLFGGRWWGAAQAAQYAAEQGRFGIGKTLYALWVAPWSTAFQSQYYANPPAAFRGALETASGNNVFAAVFGTLGIGVIGFLPLWLLARPKGTSSRAPGWFAAYGGAFVLVWFALTHQTRYLIPILPILLIPAVAGARAFWHEGRLWRAGIGAFCALAILWGLAPLNALVEPCWAVAWGGESQDAYLSRTEPTYNVCKAVNAQLPANTRLLLLNEVRGFYLDRPYEWGDGAQSTVIPWETLRSAEDMNRVLKEQGVTHVLINWGPAPSPNERWPDLAKQAIDSGAWRETIREKGFAVYAVGPSQ
ncbi:MAG TPA: hypothetical protein VGM51_16445 [Armatimonadota bacterium]|jgi:hypothetical protein